MRAVVLWLAAAASSATQLHTSPLAGPAENAPLSVAEPIGHSASLSVAEPIGDSSPLVYVDATEPILAPPQKPVEPSPTPPNVPLVGDTVKAHTASASIQCVVSLSVQYFLVYTALALVRTGADIFGFEYGNMPVKDILTSATYTVAFAPMLAVLFLGCRMRITWLTQGRGQPPEYVQVAMYCCTYAVLAMTLVAICIPIFTGKVIGVDPRTGEIPPDHHPFNNTGAAIGFTVLKYLILLALYLGVAVVIYGTVMFEPPPGTWPKGTPPVSPAVQCVLILSVQYFCVFGGIQVARSIDEWLALDMTTLKEAMEAATMSIFFAPMLAVLFIAARMRALQMDPVNGAPQSWAQYCFYACTYALLVQTVLCILIPLVLGGSSREGPVKGDIVFEVSNNQTLGSVLTTVRFCIMLCIYVGFTCVIVSVFTLQHPQGAEYTPPISVTMQCVLNLTVQFFFVYLMLWIAQTLKDFTNLECATLSDLMDNARGTINFCPMLAILFVGARMRALSLTNNRGAPQGWVQDGMYMATWAVFFQFLTVLLVGLATGDKDHSETEEDGTPKWEPEHMILKYVSLALKWFTFVFLYGGVITVIAGIYTMTPETANGRGAVPLIGDGTVPFLGASVPGYGGLPEPVGPNDLPGAPNR